MFPVTMVPIPRELTLLADWDRSVSRICKRRLPFHLAYHDQRAVLTAQGQRDLSDRRAPTCGSSIEGVNTNDDISSLGKSLSNASLYKPVDHDGGNNAGRDGGGGQIGDAKGDSSGASLLSSSSLTTSKRALECLSASVYDELQPFRLAHRSLIRVSSHKFYSCGSPSIHT